MKFKENELIQLQRVIAGGGAIGTIDINVENMLWYDMVVLQGAVGSFLVAIQYSFDNGATWYNYQSLTNTTTMRSYMTTYILAAKMRISITNNSGAQRTYVINLGLYKYSSLAAANALAV